MSTSITVWDWPLRLFHWLLVIAVSGAYITGTVGGEYTDWHDHFGKLTLGLLIFRLLWGFFGGQYARFKTFWPSSKDLSAYWRGQWHGQGHTPLGALAVFALLGILLALVITGLFANDDIAYQGPLYPLVEKSFSDRMSGWHAGLVNPLLLLLGLHLAAIGFYRFIKGIDLIKPMLTAEKNKIDSGSVSTPYSADGLTILSALILPVILTALVWQFAS